MDRQMIANTFWIDILKFFCVFCASCGQYLAAKGAKDTNEQNMARQMAGNTFWIDI